MATALRRAFEELNIDKVIKLEQTSQAEDDFDELADQIGIKNLNNQLKPPPEEEEDTTTDESTDTDSEDSSDSESTGDEDTEATEDGETPSDETSDTEDKGTSNEDEDKTKTDDKTSEVDEDKVEDTEAATEAYLSVYRPNRDLFITLEQEFLNTAAIKLGIATEENFFYKHLIHDEASGENGLLLKLRDLGIDFGKVALKHVAKGILIALAKMYESLVKGTKLFTRFLIRLTKNYKRYQVRITKARQILQALKQGEQKAINERYTDVAALSTLKIGKSIDFTKNVTNLHTLNEEYNQHLVAYVHGVVNSIQYTIRSVMRNGDEVPMAKQVTSIPLYGFKEVSHDGATKTMRFSKDLPGDKYFALAIPSENLNEYEEIKQAYRESRSFVSVDDGLSSQLVQACAYMELDYMEGFLDSLDKLCRYGMTVEKSFKDLEGYRSKLKPDLQSYINFITSAKDHVTVKQSLAELVALKTDFLDTTVIAGAMHIHNVNSQVLSYGLSMVKTMLTKRAL